MVNNCSLQLPLLELFTRLREAGLPLGMEEYQLALRSLQAGFGVSDYDALARLCRTLWVKSAEDKLLFDYHFEQVVATEAELLRARENSISATSAPEVLSKYPAIRWWNRLSKRNRYFTLGSGFVVATAAMVFWFTRASSKPCLVFTSTPVQEATVGEEYAYNVKVNACQTARGNTPKVEAIDLPSWLKLNDNGDGTVTLSGVPTDSEDVNVRLWDLNGDQQAILKHQRQDDNVVFSPDGKTIVTHSKDGKIRLWDRAGKLQAELEHKDEEVAKIEFSPDHRFLATVAYPKEVDQHNTTENNEEAVSTVRLWSLSGELLKTIKSTDYISRVDLSPDNQNIAATSSDGTVRLWDLQGNLLKEFDHPDKVYEVGFSPNGQHLTTAFSNDTIYLRNLKQNQTIALQHSGKMTHWGFSPHGDRLVTVSSNNTVRLWNNAGTKLAEFTSPEEIYGFEFSPNGDRLVTLSQNMLRLWDDAGIRLAKFKSPERVTDFRLSLDGRGRLVTVSEDGTVQLWDIDGNPLAKRKLPWDLRDLYFSPNGKHIVFKTYDGVYLLNLAEDQLVESKLSGGTSALGFSSDSERFFTLLDDYSVQMWNTSNTLLSPPKTFKGRYFSNQSSDDYFVTISQDKIYLWNTSGNQLAEFKLPEKEELKNVEFVPNSDRLITISQNNTVRLWNTSGNQLAEHKLISDVFLSPNGKYLIGIQAGKAKLQPLSLIGDKLSQLDLPDGISEIELSDEIKEPVFSPNGNYFTVTLSNGITQLLEVEGNRLSELKTSETINGATFSPDNEYLAIVEANDIVCLRSLKGNQPAEKLELHGQGSSNHLRYRDNYYWYGDDYYRYRNRFYRYRQGSSNYFRYRDDYYWYGDDYYRYRNRFYQSITGKDQTVHFNVNGDRFTTNTKDGRVRLWSLEGELLEDFDPQQDSVIRFSSDGERFITALEDNQIRLSELQDNETTYWKLPGQLQESEFNPDGKHLTTITATDLIQWWNLDKNQLSTLNLLEKVHSVAVAPTGKYLATVLEDNIVRIWDTEKKQVGELKFLSNVNKVKFSPDGEHLAAALEDNTIQLWSVKGTLLGQLQPQSSFEWFDFIPNSDRLITVSSNNTVQLWNLQGEPLVELEHKYIEGSQGAGIVFSPNGKYFTTILEKDGKEIVKLLSSDGKPLAKTEAMDLIKQISFSPDSEHFITSLEDNTIQLWDLQGKKLAELDQQHNDQDRFSPDGKYLITTSNRYVIYLRDLEGNPLEELQHPEPVDNISFSPDGKYLTTRAGDVTYLWDSQGNQLAKSQAQGSYTRVSFSPGGKYLLKQGNRKIYVQDLQGKEVLELPVLGDRRDPQTVDISAFFLDDQHIVIKLYDYQSRKSSIKLWNLEGKLLKQLEDQDEIFFSADSKQFATLQQRPESRENTIRLWNLQGKELARFDPQGKVEEIYINPGGERLTTVEFNTSPEDTAQVDATIKLWDLKGKLLRKLPPIRLYGGWSYEGDFVSFNPDGQTFATREGRNVRLWNLEGEPIGKLEHSTEVTQIQYSVNGQSLVTNSGNGIIRSWDIGNRQFDKPKSEYESGAGNISVNLSPDGKYLGVSVQEDTVHLWNLQGNQQAKFDLQGQVSDIKFSLNGIYLATASNNGSARLWNLNGKQVVEFKHKGQINTVNFSPNSRSLVTASGDGTARLWDLKGKELARLWHEGQVDQAAFSPNGQYLITSTQGYSTTLWDLKGNRLREIKQNNSLDFGAYRENQFWDKPLTVPFLINSLPKSIVTQWNLDGQQVAKLEVPNALEQFDLSPDSESLIDLEDGIVNLWSIQSKQPIQLNSKGQIVKASFSPNGEYLATIADENTYDVRLKATDASGLTDEQSFTITAVQNPVPNKRELKDVNLTYFILGGLLSPLILAGGYIVTRQQIQRRAKQNTSQDTNPEQPAEPSSPPIQTNLLKELEDETQVAQAIQHSTKNTPDTPHSLLSENNEYFPVTRRQMKQNWRYLRRFIRQGPPTELDIEATVKQIGRQGLLLETVLVPRRVNRTELLLIVDRDGSMVPFHALSDRLIETALQGGRLGRAGIYYFHNCPEQYLYHDPTHQDAETLKDALSKIYSDFTGVLIFSDAGAARGGLSPERVKLTETFLDQLKQQVRYIAWLNPMPQSCWIGTSAGEIARLVPMFEFSRQGMQSAIGVLRGKLVTNPVFSL